MRWMHASVVLFVFLLYASAGAAASEGVSMTIDKSVDIERQNYSMTEKATLYCMQNSISWCESDASWFDAFVLLTGMDEQYSSVVSWFNDSGSKPDTVVLG